MLSVSELSIILFALLSSLVTFVLVDSSFKTTWCTLTLSFVLASIFMILHYLYCRAGSSTQDKNILDM